MSHPVENIMRSTMEQLRQMVDVNTIVGSPVETGSGTVLLPVSKVSMGFVSGGGEYIKGQAATPVKRAGEALDASEGRYPFAGTAAQYKCGAERLIDMMPEIIAAIERMAGSTNGESKEETAE